MPRLHLVVPLVVLSSVCAPGIGRANPTAGDRTFSVAVGGFVIGESLLLLAKGAHERGHFAVSVDLTRDDVSINRADRAEDYYVLWALSASARAYTHRRGRGLFAELGLGYALATLEATDASGALARDRGGLPLVGWGLGVRLGQSRGLFGEIGLRGSIALGEQHLHTDPVPPPGSTDEALSERSWYFARWGSSAQLYLAIGYSF